MRGVELLRVALATRGAVGTRAAFGGGGGVMAAASGVWARRSAGDLPRVEDVTDVVAAVRFGEHTTVRTVCDTLFVPTCSPTEGVAIAKALISGFPGIATVVGDAVAVDSDCVASSTLDALPPGSIAMLPDAAGAVAMALEPVESLLPVIGDADLRPIRYLLRHSDAHLALESNMGWAYALMSGPAANLSSHLEQLHRVQHAINEGRSSFHQLVGGFGTGKSTFAAALALRAHANGTLVLRGRCDDNSQDTADALVEALGTCIDGISRRRLRKEVDGVAPMTSAVISDWPMRLGLGAAGLRATSIDRVIDAAVSTIVHVARDQPVMLLLEERARRRPRAVRRHRACDVAHVGEGDRRRYHVSSTLVAPGLR